MNIHVLRIPKDLVKIEIRDLLGGQRQASVYLAYNASPSRRRERLQDLLRQRRFIPVRDGEHFSFISREHVYWLKMDLIEAVDEFDPRAESASGSVSAGVKVIFDDGSQVSGGIRYVLPESACRVGDYLENLPQFFAIRTPDHLYFANRDHILEVIPIDEVKK